MIMNQDQNKDKKRNFFSRNKLIYIGALMIWMATVVLTLELKTLLTPGNFPAGSDPSSDLTTASFCVVFAVLGGLLLWRGVLEREKRLEERLERFFNTAIIFMCVVLTVNFVTCVLLFSANRAFAAVSQPTLRDEPAPDYSIPVFSTPAPAEPTPTYDPTSAFMAGPVVSPLDGMRVGSIWISLTPAKDSIHFIQVFLDRIVCNVQSGSPSGVLAVDKSQQLIDGPIQLQGDRSFFAAQDMDSIHGIISTLDQGIGTVYLRYKDPVTNRTCDLGSFEWSATLTQN